MVTNKMSLTEFLVARLTEEEAFAAEWEASRNPGRWFKTQWLFDNVGPVNWDEAEHIAHWSPARVLAECEVKRKIVDELLALELQIHGEWGVGPMDENWIPGLRALAQLYADHKDYQQEWSE